MTSSSIPNAGFTPGPWAVETNTARISVVNPRAVRKGPLGGGGRLIAYSPVRLDSVQAPTALANARLIAAAPELYAKVERAAFIFRTYAEMHRAKKTDEGDAKAASNDVIAEEMEAALAKARGEA